MRVGMIGAVLGLCSRLALGCEEVDPERLQCPVPDRVTLAVHFKDQVGIPPAFRESVLRIVRASLAEGGIDVTYTSTILPGQPNALVAYYVNVPAFAAACEELDFAGGPKAYQGFAGLEERVTYQRVTAQLVWDQDWCPAGVVSALSTVMLHEIGHALGLPHVGEVERTDVPINSPDGRWNILMDGVPAGVACDLDPMILDHDDLPSGFDPIQYRMMRDTASGGHLWKRLQSVGFDYQQYVNSLNKDVHKRPVTTPIPPLSP